MTWRKYSFTTVNMDAEIKRPSFFQITTVVLALDLSVTEMGSMTVAKVRGQGLNMEMKQ